MKTYLSVFLLYLQLNRLVTGDTDSRNNKIRSSSHDINSIYETLTEHDFDALRREMMLFAKSECVEAIHDSLMNFLRTLQVSNSTGIRQPRQDYDYDGDDDEDGDNAAGAAQGAAGLLGGVGGNLPPVVPQVFSALTEAFTGLNTVINQTTGQSSLPGFLFNGFANLVGQFQGTRSPPVTPPPYYPVPPGNTAIRPPYQVYPISNQNRVQSVSNQGPIPGTPIRGPAVASNRPLGSRPIGTAPRPNLSPLPSPKPKPKPRPQPPKTSLWNIYRSFRPATTEGALTQFQLAHPEGFSNELLSSISNSLSKIRATTSRTQPQPAFALIYEPAKLKPITSSSQQLKPSQLLQNKLQGADDKDEEAAEISGVNSPTTTLANENNKVKSPWEANPVVPLRPSSQNAFNSNILQSQSLQNTAQQQQVPGSNENSAVVQQNAALQLQNQIQAFQQALEQGLVQNSPSTNGIFARPTKLPSFVAQAQPQHVSTPSTPVTQSITDAEHENENQSKYTNLLVQNLGKVKITLPPGVLSEIPKKVIGDTPPVASVNEPIVINADISKTTISPLLETQTEQVNVDDSSLEISDNFQSSANEGVSSEVLAATTEAPPTFQETAEEESDIDSSATAQTFAQQFSQLNFQIAQKQTTEDNHPILPAEQKIPPVNAPEFPDGDDLPALSISNKRPSVDTSKIQLPLSQSEVTIFPENLINSNEEAIGLEPTIPFIKSTPSPTSPGKLVTEISLGLKFPPMNIWSTGSVAVQPNGSNDVKQHPVIINNMYYPNLQAALNANIQSSSPAPPNTSTRRKRRRRRKSTTPPPQEYDYYDVYDEP